MKIRELAKEEIDPPLRNSIVAMRVEYGGALEIQSHIPPYFNFGVMPADYLSRRAWIWFEAGPTPLPRGFLRDMKALFEEFRRKESWEMTAHYNAGDAVAERFGRFFGFRPFLYTDEFTYARIL